MSAIFRAVTFTPVFQMLSNANGALLAGLGAGVTTVISKDGAAFAATTNAASEISNGYYKVVLTATEMDAQEVVVKCTATGALATTVRIITDPDIYTAKVTLTDDNTGTNDRYVAVWFKNGVPIGSGITSPTIQVVKASDGSDLVASTAMTQIGTTGAYRYNEGTNRVVDGAAYFAKITASIDGSTRSWEQPVSRDS